jgi:hypothetical protein
MITTERIFSDSLSNKGRFVLFSMLFRSFLVAVCVTLICGWTWIFQPWKVVQVRMMSGPIRLLLVADPQMEGRGNSWYPWLNSHFNDAYLRFMVWRGVALLGATHVAVLGDVFSYQFLPNEEFAARIERFRWCMRPASGLPVVVIAGNHDIGYGSEQTDFMRERWEQTMGRLQGRILLAPNLELVWVNAMVLDNADERNAWSWIERQNKGGVLLTHVPLHKKAGSCPGDAPELLRDHSTGRVSSQTLLSEETSNRLLAKLRPIAVFSGHDHVGCRHGVEVTLTAVQAEYWGCTGVFDGESTVLVWGLHNTPTIVLIVATLLWPLLWLIARRSDIKSKQL